MNEMCWVVCGAFKRYKMLLQIILFFPLANNSQSFAVVRLPHTSIYAFEVEWSEELSWFSTGLVEQSRNYFLMSVCEHS